MIQRIILLVQPSVDGLNGLKCVFFTVYGQPYHQNPFLFVLEVLMVVSKDSLQDKGKRKEAMSAVVVFMRFPFLDWSPHGLVDCKVK